MYLFLLPLGSSGQACGFGHRKLWILWRMGDVSWGDVFCPPHPAHHPKMTPDPFMCLYQTVQVRNSDESLWPCVYTPESRKEGNQPRSAKSGEVRERITAVIYLTEPEFVSHHLCWENLQPTENSGISGTEERSLGKCPQRGPKHVATGKEGMSACLLLPYWLFLEIHQQDDS